MKLTRFFAGFIIAVFIITMIALKAMAGELAFSCFSLVFLSVSL